MGVHVLAISKISLFLHDRNGSKFHQKETCMPIRKYSLKYTFLNHIWDILGPCFGYFYNIFASRCMKWLTLLLMSHAPQIEKYSLMFNYWNHIGSMFGP